MSPIKLKFTSFVIAFIGSVNVAFSQDIPLFNQKVTNSFLYNPALTGFETASINFVYKKAFSNVHGAPQTNALSVQSPFRKSRFGIGLLFYQDQVNFLRNSLVLGSFAYHLRIQSQTYLSMGLSGEANRIGVVTGTNFTQSTPNPLYEALAQQSATRFDFSFGVNLRTPVINTGFSVNRLSTSMGQYTAENFITNFYSVYASLIFWSAEHTSRLEPFIAYRELSSTGKFCDLGLYYTMNNKLMLGLTGRTSGVVGIVLGFNVNANLSIAYSPEQSIGSVTRQVGQTHEVDIQYMFDPPGEKLGHNKHMSLDYVQYPAENARSLPSSVRRRQKDNFKGYKRSKRGSSNYRKRKHQGKRY